MTTRKLFIAILFLALFVMATREISDPDFWWHLRTGQFISDTFSIPRADIFSHTNFGKPWVAHEWLSELFIYAIYRLGSFQLLSLVFAAIIALTFTFVYARSDGKPLIAGFAMLFAALATAPTWGVRPQMISLLLASVSLWVLDVGNWGMVIGKWKLEIGDWRLRWALIPLMILWVNLHSGFMLGIVILAVYLFGEFVQQLPITNYRALISSLTTPALLLIPCILAVMLNPNGATMYVYPFETLTSRAMQTYIQEWFSPDFHALEWQPFALLLLGTLASFAISRKRPSIAEIILLVGFGYAGLRSARNIPIFAIIAAPIIARNVWDWLQVRGWDRHLTFRGALTRGTQMLNWVLFLLVAAVGVLWIEVVTSKQNAAEREKFPTAAVDFLKAQGVKGELYNWYDWGGYLIWRLYPTRVFIDGRADVYGDVFIEEFLRAYRAQPGWSEEFSQYGVSTVLIEPGAPLAGQIAQDATWRKVYEDKQAVIFQK